MLKALFKYSTSVSTTYFSLILRQSLLFSLFHSLPYFSLFSLFFFFFALHPRSILPQSSDIQRTLIVYSCALSPPPHVAKNFLPSPNDFLMIFIYLFSPFASGISLYRFALLLYLRHIRDLPYIYRTGAARKKRKEISVYKHEPTHTHTYARISYTMKNFLQLFVRYNLWV